MKNLKFSGIVSAVIILSMSICMFSCDFGAKGTSNQKVDSLNVSTADTISKDSLKVVSTDTAVLQKPTK